MNSKPTTQPAAPASHRRQVSIALAHGDPFEFSVKQQTDPLARLPDSEVIHRLVAKTADGEEDNVNTRVDFGAKAEELRTGDDVSTLLQLKLPEDLAKDLDLVPGSNSSRRLLLESEDHQRARRMIVEYHGTRRELSSFVNLSMLLSRLSPKFETTPKAVGDSIATLANNGAKDLFIVGGKPQNITSITFLFQSSKCGIVPGITVDALRARWYDNGDNAPITATLQRYYTECSYNQLQFLKENNHVFGPVDVDCKGVGSKGPYDLLNLKGNGVNLDAEMYGLWDRAKDYLKANFPDLYEPRVRDSFRRKLIIFPFNPAVADWAGMANLGCPGPGFDCLTWLNPGVGDTSVDLTTTFQELGHNIGLAHSSRIACDPDTGVCAKDEYGDPTDPMGQSGPTDPDKGIVCPSAPQSYKAGWASPMEDGAFKWTDLKVGQPKIYTLPSMATTKNNMLRITVDQTGIAGNGEGDKGPQRAIYISFRARQDRPGGYDSGLQDMFNNAVWVHEYNETANALSANIRNPPYVLAMLTAEPVPDMWVGPTFGIQEFKYDTPSAGPGGLKIVFGVVEGNKATVSICRYTAKRETDAGDDGCTNGADDDCDGVADIDADPDCLAFPAASGLLLAAAAAAGSVAPTAAFATAASG
ncbi:hypothetical protein GPECTOR_40g608 [Gonium pectorale]|uniref:Peptidase M11 gametolysin domain-containing protein n=1 Tax=Gonium pectorale TaxID=33097 RepID=A0A150GAL5_GONPE|nr:hypothetical protein GPECTOR_40g608 [Gonium pectorale]|eukprot:KXZ46874.1 hypothetical protein GPECTOR_40g608 [Gonium pectorale]